MGERGVRLESVRLSCWTRVHDHTLSWVLVIALSSCNHLAIGGCQDFYGCDKQLGAADIVVNITYSCVQYEMSRSYWSIVFNITNRTEVTDKTESWYLKLWENGSNSSFPCKPLKAGNSLFKIDVPVGDPDKEWFYASVVHIDNSSQETQLSQCTKVSRCNNGCEWKQKELLKYKKSTNYVVLGYPHSVSVTEDKKVTLNLCILWKNPRACETLHISFFLVEVSGKSCHNPYHGDYINKQESVMVYPEVEVAELCNNCQANCVTHKENITKITVTLEECPTPTTSQPPMKSQSLTSQSPTTTTQPPSTSQTSTSQTPTGQVTSNMVVSITESKSIHSVWIGLCVGGLLLVLFVILVLLIRCLNIDIKSCCGWNKKHVGPITQGSSGSPSVTKSDDGVSLASSPCLHDVMVLYHAGNKQKALFSRLVVVQGLREMNIDCTSPDYEDGMDRGIPNWVKNTLDNVNAVVAVCCEEFYNAFWESNDLVDHESGIISEFARQLTGRHGVPRFISVITQRDEQQYVPDTFRDQASIVCLQSHEDFDKLLRIINDVASYDLPPLGQLPKNPGLSVEDGDEYPQDLKETWDKVKSNFVASLDEQGSDSA